MHRLRLAVLVALTVLAAATGFSTAAQASTVTPAPTPCLFDDPFSCGLTLPDGTVPHPTGGGRHPGQPNDGGISGGNHDTYCAEQRAAMGDSANTAFGMQLLASIGC
jgi:hypothetical protein